MIWSPRVAFVFVLNAFFEGEGEGGILGVLSVVKSSRLWCRETEPLVLCA